MVITVCTDNAQLIYTKKTTKAAIKQPANQPKTYAHAKVALMVQLKLAIAVLRLNCRSTQSACQFYSLLC